MAKYVDVHLIYLVLYTGFVNWSCDWLVQVCSHTQCSNLHNDSRIQCFIHGSCLQFTDDSTIPNSMFLHIENIDNCEENETEGKWPRLIYV